MFAPKKVLVIDDNPDSRFLLSKTLIRKFPQVVVFECADSTAALRMAEGDQVDAVVLHRAADVLGVELVRLVRAANRSVPILMVSGADWSIEAREAGADFFLSYDEWLRIGTVLAALLALPPPGDPGYRSGGGPPCRREGNSPDTELPWSLSGVQRRGTMS